MEQFAAPSPPVAPPSQEDASPPVSARLQDPLLDGAMHFFALLAQQSAMADDVAVATVRAQLGEFLSPKAAERLAGLFGQLLHVPQDPAEVCEPLRAKFTYADRFYILLKASEFRRHAARGGTSPDLPEPLLRRLGITEADARILSAINAGWDRCLAAAAVPDATARLLPVMDTERPGALWLPAAGVRALFLTVDRQFYVARFSDHPLQIAGRAASRDAFVHIQRGETAVVAGKRVTCADLWRYFRQAARPRQQDAIHIRANADETLLGPDPDPDADFFLTLDGVAPVLEIPPPAHAGDVAFDGRPVTARVPAWLGDEIVCHGRPLPVRKLVAYAQHDHFAFTPGAGVCTISNDPHAVVHVHDAADRVWQARMELTAAGELRVFTGDCPHLIRVSGKLVNGSAPVRPGDLIRLYGVNLRVSADAAGTLAVKAHDEHFSTVSVEKVTHRFADGNPALDDVSFELQRGDLICVLGPSGCGKSTLLNVLNGTIRPATGDVRLDDVSLFDQPLLRRRIGFVPQDDLLQENLTVRENLSFAARLRRPGGTAASRALQVEAALGEIDLRERRHSLIGSALDKHLSGGQRKRVNVGLELVGPSSLLLLDEPTSGLSAGDAHKIVDVLRARADDGDIVLAVLHQPGARTLEAFDKVLVLDKGGRLAFYGGVTDCYRFFAETLPGASAAGVNGAAAAPHEPDIIFEALEQPKIRLDGSPAPERRYPPQYWQERYRSLASRFFPAPLREEGALPPPALPARQSSFFALCRVLLRRECLNKWRGRSALLMSLASAAFLGAAAALACRVGVEGQYSYRKNEALLNYMFLTVIVGLFLAVSGSVQEIIRDRAILLRERMLGIPFPAYLQSKFIALLLIYGCQITLYLAVGFWILRIPELFGAWWVFLLVVGCTGIALGLALSAIPKLSERAAAVFVPLVIIPQIILSGADPFPYSKMGHLKFSPDETASPPALAQAMPSRWAFEGLVALHRERCFANRVAQAGTLLTSDDASADTRSRFFKLGLNRDPLFRRDRPGDYPAQRQRFAEAYEARFHQPLTDERLAALYLLASDHCTAREPGSDITPMFERNAEAFYRSVREADRFAWEHRIPGTNWRVATATFDGIVLGLFAAGFLGVCWLQQRTWRAKPMTGRRQRKTSVPEKIASRAS